MNTQINIRLPGKLLTSARSYAEEHGFGTLQDFLKETVREKLFDQAEISKAELALVKRLVKASESKKLYGTEEELFKKLKG
jgi:hypothetical protein